MASGKEIRTKIASVKSTQKITKAMQMVAASKLRRTQQRMAAARPYAERIRTVIGHLSEANPDFRHPYLVTREVKRVGYIVISTDKGLCGGVNVNTFREVIRDLRKWQEKGVEADLCLIGAKGISYFKRLKVNVVAVASNLGEMPKLQDLVGSIVAMTNAYREGKIDRLFLVHSVFVNTMSQTPEISTLLPVEKVVEFETEMHAYGRQSHKAALDAINAKPEYNDDVVASLKKVVEGYKKNSGYGGVSAPKKEEKAATPADDKAAKAPAKK